MTRCVEVFSIRCRSYKEGDHGGRCSRPENKWLNQSMTGRVLCWLCGFRVALRFSSFGRQQPFSCQSIIEAEFEVVDSGLVGNVGKT